MPLHGNVYESKLLWAFQVYSTWDEADLYSYVNPD
jgi:hypothetical protein